MRVGFLVSDSRSGSTLLAALISSRLDGCAVTPELRFNRLLGCADAELRRMPAGRLAGLLAADGQLRNLAVPDSVLVAALEARGRFASKGEIVRFVLRLHFEAVPAGLPDLVLVKAGNHLLQWRAVGAALPGAPFVYVLRDPRAVINSKQRTARPYAPWETLGWSGPFLMALRWRQYATAANRAERSGLPVARVRFEELMRDETSVLRELAGFLKLELSSRSGKDAYAIPRAEQGIHRLVDGGKLVTSRADAWQTELSRRDRLCVEVLTRPVMESFGYERYGRAGPVAVALALVSGFCRSAVGVARHFLSLGIRSMRRGEPARRPFL